MADEFDQFKSKPSDGGDEFDQFKSKTPQIPGTEKTGLPGMPRPRVDMKENALAHNVSGFTKTAKEYGKAALRSPFEPLGEGSLQPQLQGRHGATDEWQPETMGQKAKRMAKGLPLVGPLGTALAHGEYGEAAAHGLADVAGGLSIKGAAKMPGMIRETMASRAEKASESAAVQAPSIITEAIGPRGEVSANAPGGFKEVISRGLPDLAKAQGELGYKIADAPKNGAVLATHEAIKIAKNNLMSQVRGEAGKVQADLRSIAKKVMDEKGSEGAPDAIAISELRKIFSDPNGMPLVSDVLNQLSVVNAKLRNYYSKNPSERSAMTKAVPRIAKLEQQANALREVAYRALDPENGGIGPRELMRRYGSLSELDKQIMRVPQQGRGLADKSYSIKQRFKGVPRTDELEHAKADTALRKAFKNYQVEPNQVRFSPPGQRPTGP